MEEAVDLLLNLADVVLEGTLSGDGFPDQILIKKVILSFLQGAYAFFHLAIDNDHTFQAFHVLECSEASFELLDAVIVC